MLPQTRRAVEALKEAGLTRDQFRIRTPWKQDKGYGTTTIVLLCPYAQTAPYLQNDFFKHLEIATGEVLKERSNSNGTLDRGA